MPPLNRMSCLSALSLKLLAMGLMLCDHLWATLVPGAMWLTSLGRLAFPIFAFQLVEGFAHTRSFKRYLLRLLLFALISEVPYDLMTGGSPFYPVGQNVMFTFLEALLLVRLLELCRSRSRGLFLAMVPVCLVLGFALGFVTMVDYYGFGVLTVLVFYLSRKLKWGWLLQLAGLWVINVSLMGGMDIPLELFGHTFFLSQQGLAVLALVPIWLYNGRQGRHSRAIQYACYAFYPLHMLALSLPALYLIP